MILLRHAHPEIVPGVDPSEWRLSQTGRETAAGVALRLAGYRPDAVFTSPEPKARETAAIVAHALQLEVAVIEELHEHERRGVPFFSTREAFAARVLTMFATPEKKVFGNESAVACLRRYAAGIDHVLRAGKRQPIVVSHGTVMALYIAQWTGLDAAALWQAIDMAGFAVLGENAAFSGITNPEPPP